MAAMDEFREERERIKQADLKTKIQYFLDYYKWHTIIGISVIVLVVSLIYSMVTNKEDAFTGYFINSQASLMTDFDLTNELASSFAENAGIDLNEYEVFIDSSLGYNVGGTDESSVLTAQRLSVTVAGQDTDFIAADTNTFSELFHLGGFYDLRDIYSEQDLKKYNDYLYYVDMEVIRQQEAILETGSMDFLLPEYDHYAPENMTDPVPIGICVEDSPKIDALYTYYNGRVPLGIPQSSERVETALQFIDYLMEGLVTE